jgi:hypothetical protein
MHVLRLLVGTLELRPYVFVFLVVYLANRDHTPRLAPRGGVHASSR